MNRGFNRVARMVTVAAALLVAPALVQAQTLKESSSGVTFKVHRSILGQPQTCIGVGIRKAFVFFKVYAAGFYIDDSTGKPSFQQLLDSVGGNVDALRESAKLYNWVITKDVGKSMEWVFTRDLEKGKMTKVIRESLERELGDLNAPDLKEPADKFLAAVDVPLKKWQRLMLVQRPGFQILAVLDGKVVVNVHSKKISQAIWRIYFGKHPVQSNLKTGLVAHIENLK